MLEMPWLIPGADGLPIIGNAHEPRGRGRGVVLIAHGFKGYKDYGMFPRLARELARAGLLAHRFNFSHSGMTNDLATFARPDLFEQDTWNRQVFDMQAVIGAVSRGELAGRGLPYVLFGHSRGGITALLAAGRMADDRARPQPAGVITAAAPASCNPFSQDEQRRLLETGWLESPSSRTGQILRVGRPFLREQLDDPAGHDVTALVARIRCPVLIVHGSADPTVPPECADVLARAARHGERVLIEGADHVFNTPNPDPIDEPPGEALRQLTEATVAFASRVCGEA